MKSKPGGGNVPHMRYVQDARRSNETGFHDKSKRQKNRQDRRKAKKELRPQSWSESSFFYAVLGKTDSQRVEPCRERNT